MAITTNAICSTFKKELLRGFHDFDTSGDGGDTYKLAMYTSSATLGKSTENYSTNPGGGSNTEVTSSGYTAGGGTLVNQGVKVSSSVAITDFADLSSDELIGGFDEIKGKKIRINGYLEEFSLSRKEADELIMTAREIAYKYSYGKR